MTDYVGNEQNVYLVHIVAHQSVLESLADMISREYSYSSQVSSASSFGGCVGGGGRWEMWAEGAGAGGQEGLTCMSHEYAVELQGVSW